MLHVDIIMLHVDMNKWQVTLLCCMLISNILHVMGGGAESGNDTCRANTYPHPGGSTEIVLLTFFHSPHCQLLFCLDHSSCTLWRKQTSLSEGTEKMKCIVRLKLLKFNTEFLKISHTHKETIYICIH